MKKHIFYVTPQSLLLTAAVVWFLAGFNIARIGMMASDQAWTILSIIASAAVFLVFYGLIFRRLVRKHTARIKRYEKEMVHILHFFDAKSYGIMAFMMTFGILLRRSNLWPAHCIKTFYLGLGLALIAAGTGFMVKYLGNCKHAAKV